MKISLTPEQRKALENLWFIYGNGGLKHTHGNHKHIQSILERGDDDREFFKRQSRIPGWDPLMPECEIDVDKVLKWKTECEECHSSLTIQNRHGNSNVCQTCFRELEEHEDMFGSSEH